MQLKIATAVIAASMLSACYSNPPVADAPAPPPMPTQQQPAPMPMPRTMSLHDSVHAALRSGMGTAATDIQVRVDGNNVYLSGHVGSEADHKRAHDIAHAVNGVGKVYHSELVVH